MNNRWHLSRGFLCGLLVASIATLIAACTWAEDPPKPPEAAAPAAAEPAAAEEPAEPETPVMLREYQELREYKDKDGLMMPIEFDKSWGVKMTPIINAGQFASDEERDMFFAYFRFRIAELTWADNMTGKLALPQKRAVFKRSLMIPASRAPVPTLHDYMNQTALTALQNIAMKDIYHPVVRNNCMLLIGQLDQTEPDFRGEGAIPYPPALLALEAAAGDDKQIDAVRVAAMFGILRHCEYDVAATERAKLVSLLTGIVRTKQPSGAGTAVGLGWLRHRAAQALGKMAARAPEANKPEVAAALEQLIGDDNAMIVARADAAQSFGNLEKGAYSGRTPSAAGTLIGKLAIAIVTKGPVPEAGPINKDALTYCLMQTNSGLKNSDQSRGIASAATDPASKKFVKELSDKIDGLIATANDSKMEEDSRVARLKDDGDRLELWLQKTSGNLAKTN